MRVREIVVVDERERAAEVARLRVRRVSLPDVEVGESHGFGCFSGSPETALQPRNCHNRDCVNHRAGRARRHGRLAGGIRRVADMNRADRSPAPSARPSGYHTARR